jgi:hypothetical protein
MVKRCIDMSLSPADAAPALGPPPPCGEGLGVGVHIGSLSSVPPSLTLPHKGGGNVPPLLRQRCLKALHGRCA